MRRHTTASVQLTDDAKRKNPDFDVRTLNQALISTFDDRPYHWAGTHAWAGIASDQQWIAEVTTFLKEQGTTEHLEDIIGRSEY